MNQLKNQSEEQKVKTLLQICNDRVTRLDIHAKKYIDYTISVIDKNHLYEYLPDVYVYEGMYWKYVRSFRLSLNSYLKALPIYEERKDPKKMAFALIKMAETYRAAAENPKAMELLNKAENILKNTPDKGLLAELYNRKAAVNYERDYRLLNDIPESVLKVSLSFIDISENYNNGRDLSTKISNLILYGAVYRSQKNYEKAFYYFNSAEEIINKNLDSAFATYHYPTVLSNLGLTNIGIKNFEKAIGYFTKLIEFSRSKDLSFHNINAFNAMAEIYEKLGRYKEAYLYKKAEGNEFLNYYFNEDNKMLTDLQLKYENSKKEHESNVIQSRQTIYTILLIFIIIILVTFAGFIFVRQRTQKKTSLIILQQNRQLKNLNTTKDKFFSILAHDLKNPIFSISALIDLMQNNFEEFSQEEIKDYLSILHNSSTRVTELLSNLLTWSRSQRNLIAYHPAEHNISDIFNFNTPLIEPAAKQKNNRIKVVSNEDVTAFCDINQVNTILRNLLTNANKFTQDGTITIKSEANENEVIISVSDNGVGMSEEDTSKLFAIETAFSNPGTNHEKGTGLGLIICKEFAEKNKGKIWVSSELESGSTFYFSLPRSKS